MTRHAQSHVLDDPTALSRRALSTHLVLLEAAGFATVVLILWLDEISDLPHYLFGARPTPVNVAECVYETAAVAVLAAFVMLRTWFLLRRIRMLEGLLPVCAFCKKVRCGGRWIPIEEYVTDHSQARFSHGYCPECIRIHYPEYEPGGATPREVRP